jgi:hypothetical protein
MLDIITMERLSSEMPPNGKNIEKIYVPNRTTAMMKFANALEEIAGMPMTFSRDDMVRTSYLSSQARVETAAMLFIDFCEENLLTPDVVKKMTFEDYEKLFKNERDFKPTQESFEAFKKMYESTPLVDVGVCKAYMVERMTGGFSTSATLRNSIANSMLRALCDTPEKADAMKLNSRVQENQETMLRRSRTSGRVRDALAFFSLGGLYAVQFFARRRVERRLPGNETVSYNQLMRKLMKHEETSQEKFDEHVAEVSARKNEKINDEIHLKNNELEKIEKNEYTLADEILSDKINSQMIEEERFDKTENISKEINDYINDNNTR